MKIGIMGTHGTGKTTFARELIEKLPFVVLERMAFVTGVARSCPFPIDQETSEEAQRWIHYRHIIEELEAEAQADLVICDRTVLDSLVYAEVAGLRGVVRDCMNAALRWIRTYDTIYWLRPVEGRLIGDGRRDLDPAWRRAVDQQFGVWIREYLIPAIEINGKKEA